MCCWLVCNQLNKERKKELRIETDGRNMTSPPPIHTKKKNKTQKNCISPDRGDVMGGGGRLTVGMIYDRVNFLILIIFCFVPFFMCVGRSRL